MIFHRVTYCDAGTLIQRRNTPQLYSESGNDGSETQDAFRRGMLLT
jgi:hypothetical protein